MFLHFCAVLGREQFVCVPDGSTGSLNCRIFKINIKNENSSFTLNLNSIKVNRSKVTTIGIYESLMHHVPNEFFNHFMKLEKLSIQGLSLSQIDQSSFEKAGNLITLKADLNYLTHLPTFTFSHANNLETIYLRGNLIETVDERAFTGLHKLRILSLSQNSIKSLAPKTFTDCTKLKILFLNNNQLKILNLDMFKRNMYLEWLFLEQNKIQKVEGKSAVVSYLKVINLLDNFCISNYFQSEMGVGNDLEAALKECLKNKTVDVGCRVETPSALEDCEKRMSFNLKLIENFEREEANLTCVQTNVTNAAVNASAERPQSDSTQSMQSTQLMQSQIKKCKQKMEDAVQEVEAQRVQCQRKMDRQSTARNVLQKQLQRLNKQLDECEEDSGILGFLFGY